MGPFLKVCTLKITRRGMRFCYLLIVPLALSLFTLFPVPRAYASTTLPSGEVSGTSVSFHFPDPLPSSCSPTSSDYNNIRNATLLNAQYVRFDIWWDEIEPAQNSFSNCALNYYTTALSFIHAQGLQAIAVLGTNEPTWVYTACYFGLYPNVEQGAVQGYAQHVASSFGQWISYYQLGNELYSPQYFHEETCGSKPEPYMIAIAQGIQAGATTPYQTIANIYADSVPGSSCTAQGAWYTDLQNALNQAGSYINVIAVDHYPGTYCTGTWSSDGVLSSLASLASQYGKGYAITETGWSLYQSSETAQDSFAQQALSYIYTYAEKAASGNPLLFVNWYQLTDNGAGGGANPYDCCFGLQSAQTNNREAFQTVASYFHEFIGYPITFQTNSIQPGTTWCVTLDGQNQCTSGSTISFNEQPGSYTYSIADPSCGQGCQYLPSPDSSVINMGFSSVSENIAFTMQYEITPTVNVVGGGVGYSFPTLTYISGGVTQSTVLGGPGAPLYADSGSAWSISSQLAGSSQAERWQTNQQTNGVVSSPLSLDLTYYHQVLNTFSYSVNDGSTPPSPTLTSTQFGATSSNVLQTTSTALWLDSGSSYSVTNTLSANQQERWYTPSSLVQGTVSASNTVTLTYFHQFALTMSYGIVGGGSPPAPTLSGTSAGASLNESLTKQPSTYWLDANSQFRIPSQIGSTSTERWITDQQTRGIASSGSSQVFSYQHEYYIQFAVQPPGGGSVSQQSGWFNAASDLQVSATPGAGYVFQSWSSSNPSILFSSYSSPETNMIAGGSGVVTANLTLTPSTTTTSPSKSTATVVTVSSSFNSANSPSTSTTSGSGIPEFSFQLLVVSAFAALIIVTYSMARRRTIPGKLGGSPAT